MNENHESQCHDELYSTTDYKECCLSTIARCCTGTICNVKKDWSQHCVYLDNLQSNVVDYLVSVKVINKQQQQFYRITERELLMNRLSRIVDIEQPHLKICPNHRYTYGVGWSIPKGCVFMKEDGSICHLQSVRVASMHLIESIPTFPFGGKICTAHRKHLYEIDAQTIAATNAISGAHSWERTADNTDQVNQMLTMLEQSPIRYQASVIPIADQAPSSQRRLISKLRKSLAATAISIANSIAPGQGEQLIEMAGLKNVVSTRSSALTPIQENQTIEHLVHIYKAYEQQQYPFSERIQLLALLPDSMTNKEIMEAFGCSNYAVKTARKLQLATMAENKNQEPETLIRSRIDPALTDHFLSWLLDTNMLTTVAWGTTKIKLDHGDMLEIPKQVLQAKKSHIIQQYQIHCEEMSLKPLSDRTLRYILDNIGAVEQEALSGIDDIVKDAREAWLNLETLLLSLKLSKEDRINISTSMEKSKLYLKTLFTNHCSEPSKQTCATHCTIHSLSQQNSVTYIERCDHDHNGYCEDCTNVIRTLDFIDEQISQVIDIEQKNELRYDFQQARESIIELMRHLVRSVQQDAAKSILLDQMDEESAFITIDWAQKILQQKYRESQSEYFGKKGMSLLVASFTMKNSNQLEKNKFTTKTYMLALTRCSQNELDTLSGGFVLLQEFKNDYPHINKIIKRSDNASVLGGHATFESEKVFSNKLGINILIRDYSEIQRGKSICDRMAGAAKRRIRAWVNSGNNLLNASDIKKGIEYCGGVKNVKIGVAELVTDAAKIDNSGKIPEINSIRSVIYTKEGMIIRKASNIGKGRMVPYSNIQVTSNMKLIESFAPSNQSKSITRTSERTDRKATSFYFSSENSCVATFKDEDELNDHIALGQHLTIEDKLTSHDIAKIQLFDKLHDTDISKPKLGHTIASNIIVTTSTDQFIPPTTMKYFSTEGWALKIQKPRRPIDEAVKRFIKSIMNEEKLYSVKFSEIEYVRRIRTARGSDGSKLFFPSQYLTSSQVKTQIKQLSKQSFSNTNESHDDDQNDEETPYKKTPKRSRRQISVRASVRQASLSTSSLSLSSDHHDLIQNIASEDNNEEDEIAMEQEEFLKKLKKKILA